MQKFVFAFLLAFAIPFAAHAYVNPGAPTGFVNDFAGMLAPQERTLLESKLSSFALQTKHEISVVTIPSLGEDTVENFAEKLFKDWGIGKKDVDNGILLLVARDDRKFRIEVGYGLEGALTDAQSYWILTNTLTPAFKKGSYAYGLDVATNEIISALRGENLAAAYPTQRAESGGVSVDWFWIVFAIPMWLASILGRSKSWWLGGIIGGIGGVVLGFIFGFLYWGIAAIAVLAPLGLLFDYIVSHKYAESVTTHHRPPWWIGGGRGGLGGGGFGGFGGGRSGGGGASGGW